MAVGTLPKPSAGNDYYFSHLDLLQKNLRQLADRDLIESDLQGTAWAKAVFYAPFALLSHDTSSDPIFNYANQIALELFEMPWEEFTIMPSRLSAEPENRERRAQLLAEVTENGIITNYSGVRRSKRGMRFLIENATIWNLVDDVGMYRGQAAYIDQWRYL